MSIDQRIDETIKLLSDQYHPCTYCDHVDIETGENPVTFTVNPLACEINGDETKMWICKACYEDIADDI